MTGSDAERDLAREQADIEEITEKSLLLQANAAAKQHRPLGRGTHAKGVCARAQFEVFDVTAGRDPRWRRGSRRGFSRSPAYIPLSCGLGTRIQERILISRPTSDRCLSRSISPAMARTIPDAHSGRQDFSLQNTTTLPINDSPAFLAIMKLLTASNPAAGLWSLPFKDKLRVLRTLALGASCRRTRRSSPISNCAMGATCRFVTDRSTS